MLLLLVSLSISISMGVKGIGIGNGMMCGSSYSLCIAVAIVVVDGGLMSTISACCRVVYGVFTVVVVKHLLLEIARFYERVE